MADRVIHWSLTDIFEDDPNPEYTLSVCWRWLPVKKMLGEVCVVEIPGYAFSTVAEVSGEAAQECILCRDHTHERMDALMGRSYRGAQAQPPWSPGG